MSVIIDCHKRCCITKDCIWFFMAGVYFRPTPALASPTRTLSPFSIRLCLLKEPIREWRKGEMVGEKNFRIIYSSTWNCSYSQNRLCSILYSSEKIFNRTISESYEKGDFYLLSIHDPHQSCWRTGWLWRAIQIDPLA